MNIVVQIATGLEWHSLIHLLGDSREISDTPVGRFTTTCLQTARGPVAVTLLRGGTGKVNAAASAQYAILTWKPDVLVVLGTSGAIAPDLNDLDVILANRAIVYDIESTISKASEAKIQSLTTEMPVSWHLDGWPFPLKIGAVLTGDRDVTRENVPVLRAKYDALAADWESGAVAKVCAMNRIPCLILRGISDTPDSDAAGQLDKYRRNTPLVMERLWRLLPRVLDARAHEGDMQGSS